MSIQVRNYTAQPGYTDDFFKVCDFLKEINQEKVLTPGYLWPRWVWQFGPYMNMENLSSMGIVQENGIISGAAIYEGDIGEAYILCADDPLQKIKPLLLNHAMQNMHKEGQIKVFISDADINFQRLALQKGLIATQDKSSTARIDIEKPFAYNLPHGYKIISFDDKTFDADRYYNAIWRGFDNQRPRNAVEIASMQNRAGFKVPYLDLSLRILVVSPSGDYAAHCGLFYMPGSTYAYVEPVFTLPEYRTMGLGKAAVLEGLNRCGKLGAKQAYVVSSQQFYYSIGFYPIYNETRWALK